MSTIADEVARALAEAGVRFVFGIPGGPSIPYMDAMGREGIEFILVANEASAGFMADVCARLTGVPGVCHATFGPGATNLATGVGCAYLDRSPIIALTSEHSDAMRNRTTQMNIDHQALFAPITKSTTRLRELGVGETIRRAILTALAEVPGPVHIGLPAHLADEPVVPVVNVPMSSDWTPEALALPDRDHLEEARRLIQDARKPLVAVGLTAARLRLNRQITQFVEQQKMPVVLTPMAKGMLPEDHPSYAGVLFHAGSDRLASVCREADLVVGIGYDPVEFNYEAWMPEVPLLHLDTSHCDIDPAYTVAGDVCGNLEHSLGYLLEIPASGNDWDFEELAKRRKELFQFLEPRSDRFGPLAALKALREVLPADGVMTCDVGAHTHLIGQAWPTPAPRTQIMTNGWSSMGFAVPAAIAAKLCLPDRACCAVTGDGGFTMMAGEMVTARRLGLNVVFVVLVDRCLSLIKVKQQWRGSDHSVTRLYDGEFLGADHFFSAPVLRVESATEMRSAVTKAFTGNGPSIIEAVIDESEYCELIARRYK